MCKHVLKVVGIVMLVFMCGMGYAGADWMVKIRVDREYKGGAVKVDSEGRWWPVTYIRAVAKAGGSRTERLPYTLKPGEELVIFIRGNPLLELSRADSQLVYFVEMAVDKEKMEKVGNKNVTQQSFDGHKYFKVGLGEPTKELKVFPSIYQNQNNLGDQDFRRSLG